MLKQHTRHTDSKSLINEEEPSIVQWEGELKLNLILEKLEATKRNREIIGTIVLNTSLCMHPDPNSGCEAKVCCQSLSSKKRRRYGARK